MRATYIFCVLILCWLQISLAEDTSSSSTEDDIPNTPPAITTDSSDESSTDGKGLLLKAVSKGYDKVKVVIEDFHKFRHNANNLLD